MTTMTGLREITWDDLEAMALGCGVLGTGGGGDSYIILLGCRKLYKQGHRFHLIHPDDLADEDMVAELGIMGAPLVGEERLTDPDQCARPARAMETYIGKPFAAVMSAEMGGANGVMPLLVAAAMDLPMVDADPRGRAFPEMQMSGFPIQGFPLYPVTLSDIRANDVVITESASPTWSERILRRICTEMGSEAALCRPPRSGKTIKEKAIIGTASQAIRIGQAILGARADHGDPVQAVIDSEQGIEVFRGKVVDVMRRTTEGFLRGNIDINGHDGYAGQTCHIDFQNEYIIAWIDDALTVTVPELICVLDAVSGEAIGTEQIRYGQRVAVLSLAADKILTSKRGLEVVGPRAFGYDCDFLSLHERPKK
jgi:DUF917 family protein